MLEYEVVKKKNKKKRDKDMFNVFTLLIMLRGDIFTPIPMFRLEAA